MFSTQKSKTDNVSPNSMNSFKRKTKKIISVKNIHNLGGENIIRGLNSTTAANSNLNRTFK